MSNPLRGADIVARSLARLGCKRVFTLSGNHIMSVFDAALETGLDLVHVRHEAAAVHMADAWGRLTGQAGIALVTGGPGHANAVGALYTALGVAAHQRVAALPDLPTFAEQGLKDQEADTLTGIVVGAGAEAIGAA